MRTKRRLLRFGAMVLLTLLLLPGCGGKQAPGGEETTLWILTEQTDATGMNGQAGAAIQAFEADHPGVKVNLEILESEEQARAAHLEQLRTQIMAGGGPDGYLLPTGTLLWQDPVFPDVAQAMHAGLFADLSAYYDADTELHTEALQQTVMEAGVIDGARYVLPLRYEVPVAYLDAEQLAASGLDREKMASGLYGFWEEVLGSGQRSWERTAYLEGISWQLLPPIFDYEQETVCLSRQTLRTFLEREQQMAAILGLSGAGSVGLAQYWGGDIFFSETFPGKVGDLSVGFSLAAIAKSRPQPIEMFALPDVEGKVAARITYFAAAGAGSRHLELVYEFLRLFLTEEAQWEQNQRTSGLDFPAIPHEGWPVRYSGAARVLWEKCEAFYEPVEQQERLMGRNNTKHKRLLKVELTDADVPVLAEPIDRVIFPNEELNGIFSNHLAELNDWEAGNAATDVDLDQVAEDILTELEQYLAEG